VDPALVIAHTNIWPRLHCTVHADPPSCGKVALHYACQKSFRGGDQKRNNCTGQEPPSRRVQLRLLPELDNWLLVQPRTVGWP